MPEQAPLIGKEDIRGQENVSRVEKEKELASELEALGEEKPSTYEERLKDVGLTKEKSLLILHTMVEKGYYEEAYKLFEKYRVVFRTRQFTDTERLEHMLEAKNPQLSITFENLIRRYNLASSLSQFHDKRFNFGGRNPEEEDKFFLERLDFVRSLAEPVINKLVELLVNFDNKLTAVLSDGAIENF